MANFIEVSVKGIPDLQKYLDFLPAVANDAARLAINQISQRDALSLSRDAILKEVAFPTGYLTDDKLGVTQRATTANLEALITARFRPTSLARFALPGQTPESTSKRGSDGVAIMVHPGRVIRMKSAFLVRLKSGKALTEDKYNLGVAVNIRNAKQFLNKKEFYAEEANNSDYYVLYGPSVDQVFQTVASDVSPEVADRLAAEFIRQFVRLGG